MIAQHDSQRVYMIGTHHSMQKVANRKSNDKVTSGSKLPKRKVFYTVAISLILAAQAGFAPSAVAAKSSSAKLRELQRVIAQQQKQLEEQARLLESLQQQVNALSQTTEEVKEEVKEAMVPAKDQPKVTNSGNDKVKLTVSGQVNRALLFTNDGETNDLFNVDNDNSSTRVRFDGVAKPGGDLTVGSNFEVEFQSNASNEVNQENKRNASSNNFKRRKLELYFDHKKLGRLWLGHGDTASNGTSEVDLSSTTLVGYSSIADLAGGMLFRIDGDVPIVNDDGEVVAIKDTPLSTIKITDVYSNLDGLSREDRIRYDTPGFYGFKASSSWVQDRRWDLALRYGGEFNTGIGEFKTAAALAYWDKKEDNLSGAVNGSFSVLHDSGVSFTFAAGKESRSQVSDPNFWYIKLGYQTNQWLSWGETAISIDYARSDDFQQLDNNFGAVSGDMKTYGLFAVQKLDKYSTEIFLGLRNHDLEGKAGVDFKDVFAMMSGARIKF